MRSFSLLLTIVFLFLALLAAISELRRKKRHDDP